MKTKGIKPMDGFYYVGQDNYYIANLNKPNKKNPEKYLYTDSATSCIAIIVTGKNKENDPIVAIVHLSRPERYCAFFDLVKENFVGAVNVYAQGANPSDADASRSNSNQVANWVSQNMNAISPEYCEGGKSKKSKWYIENLSLSFGQGNPLDNDRDCFGIDLITMEVSNQRFDLTLDERDPTRGLQTLYCVFGLKIKPQIVLRKSTDKFTDKQIEKLVMAAQKHKPKPWSDFIYATKDEVLQTSSTPQFEVPWFFAQIRDSAIYVVNYLYLKKGK